MTTTERTYRGVTYKPNEHERASRAYVEHIYRGKRYEAPLRHEAAQIDESTELHYRGSVYHHRQEEAAFKLKT